jgi:[citrate (pro-3S)-lyase] ligase
MIQCAELNLSIEKNKEAAANFLKGHGLRMEELERLFVLRDEKDKWVGCGGRYRNVLKCFALDETRRNEALLDTLVTALVTDSYRQGYEDLFIYTKSGYGEMFASFGFSPVADTGSVVLLHRGPNTVARVLERMKVDISPSDLVGAIVVNSNPFTKGHRYLIESSSRKVDKLIVFVVENDASRFPFKDRYRLVKEGVSDLKNVHVFPSTQYIISNATFPSYFLKEKEMADEQHAILDSLIFKNYFVRHFNIRKRFLGEEPIDMTTNLYNSTLLKVLPPECEVIVIPRKTLDEKVISASTVRRELDKGNFDAIRELVPDVTYRYLEENYGRHS